MCCSSSPPSRCPQLRSVLGSRETPPLAPGIKTPRARPHHRQDDEVRCAELLQASATKTMAYLASEEARDRNPVTLPFLKPWLRRWSSTRTRSTSPKTPPPSIRAFTNGAGNCENSARRIILSRLCEFAPFCFVCRFRKSCHSPYYALCAEGEGTQGHAATPAGAAGRSRLGPKGTTFKRGTLCSCSGLCLWQGQSAVWHARHLAAEGALFGSGEG